MKQNKMKRHDAIFEGSSISPNNLFDYGERQIMDYIHMFHVKRRSNFFDIYSYSSYSNFIIHFEYDLCSLWLRTIWKKKIDKKSLTNAFDNLSKSYPDFFVQESIDMSIKVFERVYEVIKAYLINVEYYELIPEFDNKARLFKELLKNIRKQYEPKGLPKRLPDGVVKR